MPIWEELIERAQQEAAETGSPVVEVEHLLLAVLRTPSERLREVLEHLGWTRRLWRLTSGARWPSPGRPGDGFRQYGND